jgi:hypothetical protein
LKTVPVDDGLIISLQDYSDKTGVPVAWCVSEALFDWLANVAPVTLREAGLEPLKVRYIVRKERKFTRSRLRRLIEHRR